MGILTWLIAACFDVAIVAVTVVTVSIGHEERGTAGQRGIGSGDGDSNCWLHAEMMISAAGWLVDRVKSIRISHSLWVRFNGKLT